MDLILEFHPDSSRIQKLKPETVMRKVLYFDFAGADETSWKKLNRQMYKSDLSEKSPEYSRIYAHPLIHEDRTAKGPARFEFVIQYWFFYPFNDGGNNHEGDWEHMNVRITTSARKGNLLTGQDIETILDHHNVDILEGLLIKKVDYYFHHFVMTLDYQKVDFLQPRDNVWAAIKKLKQEKMLQNWISEQIYYRMHLVKDSVNTHPIGYIGADNQGLDQLLAGFGGKNRNSHGTYPFTGVWKNVGPLGATEKINGDKEFRFFLPRILPSKAPLVPFTAGVRNFKQVDDIKLNGESIDRKDTPWFHNPTFPYLPNTFHFGAGIELFPKRNYGISRFPFLGQIASLGKPEIGFRLEYTIHLHRLGDDVPEARKQGNITRHEFAAAVVIGF